MIVGSLPFEHDNQTQLYEKIIEGKFKVPNYMSSICKDLLNNVLNTDCNQRYNIEQIKNHEFITKYNDQQSLENNNITYINNKVLNQLTQYGLSVETASTYLEQKMHNYITATYYILLHQQPKHIKTEQEMSVQELIAFKKSQKQLQSKQQPLKERTKVEIHEDLDQILKIQIESEKSYKKVSFDQTIQKLEIEVDNKQSGFKNQNFFDSKIDPIVINMADQSEDSNELSRTIKYAEKLKNGSIYNSNTDTDNKIIQQHQNLVSQNQENLQLYKQQLLQQDILISYQKELLEQQIEKEIQHNENVIKNNLQIINENDKQIQENNQKIKENLLLDSSQLIVSSDSQKSINSPQKIIKLDDIIKQTELIKNKFYKDKKDEFLFKNNEEAKELMVDISKTINQDILQSKKYHVNDDSQEVVQFINKKPGLIETYQNKLMQQKKFYDFSPLPQNPKSSSLEVNIKKDSKIDNKVIDEFQNQQDGPKKYIEKFKTSYKKLNIQQLQSQYDKYRREQEKSRQMNQSHSKSNEKSISKINKQFYNKKELDSVIKPLSPVNQKLSQTQSYMMHKKSLTIPNKSIENNKFITPDKRDKLNNFSANHKNNSNKKNFIRENKISFKNKQNKAKSQHVNNQQTIHQPKFSQNISKEKKSIDKVQKIQPRISNIQPEFSFKFQDNTFRAPKTLFRPQINQTKATDDYIKLKTQTQPSQKHVQNLKSQNLNYKGFSNKQKFFCEPKNEHNNSVNNPNLLKNNKQKVHFGPFNLNSAFNNKPNILLDKLQEILTNNQITHEKLNPFEIQLKTLQSKIEILSLQEMKNLQLIQFIPNKINENLSTCLSTFSTILSQLKQSLLK